MLVDQSTNSRTKCLFLFRTLRRTVSFRLTAHFTLHLTDPYQIPAEASKPLIPKIIQYPRTYQYGDWRHVESAAPIPVPVQMRMPRLYRVDVFETPANYARRSVYI